METRQKHSSPALPCAEIGTIPADAFRMFPLIELAASFGLAPAHGRGSSSGAARRMLPRGSVLAAADVWAPSASAPGIAAALPAALWLGHQPHCALPCPSTSYCPVPCPSCCPQLGSARSSPCSHRTRDASPLCFSIQPGHSSRAEMSRDNSTSLRHWLLPQHPPSCEPHVLRQVTPNSMKSSRWSHCL